VQNQVLHHSSFNIHHPSLVREAAAKVKTFKGIFQMFLSIIFKKI